MSSTSSPDASSGPPNAGAAQRYRGITARDIALIAVFAAIIAVLSMPFAIPVGPVPITLQTLGVMLAPSVLGAKRGTLAVLVFLALAMAGLPLLAGGRGGLAPFLGVTAGYLYGFVLGALVIGLIVDRMVKYRMTWGILANLLGGILVVYLVGVPWMAVVTGDALLSAVVSAGAFLPGDLAKAVAAAAIAAGVHRAYPVPPAGRPVPEVNRQ
ncbi:biotin transporter BioY [Lipingzhangella sp. LS1_29]|uniref:Biotin transporter n=1 Tax=Lipingzhangella rawalii TaxID=2055835 RepID=A0ABU2HAY1_9ACTN|nr:biotin transporter BioY [Lipingzhangella rawalii]MDS1271985.1 biotin transporter BioY [Lipingzhangella rawalii]